MKVNNNTILTNGTCIEVFTPGQCFPLRFNMKGFDFDMIIEITVNLTIICRDCVDVESVLLRQGFEKVTADMLKR